MDLPLEWGKESTTQVTNALLKCNECDLTTQVLSHEARGSWTDLEIVCPIHEIMKKGMSTEVYKRFEELEPYIDRRKSVDQSLVCVKCGTALTVRNARIRKELIELDVRCREDHSDKRYYLPNLEHEVLVGIYKHLYECPRCHENIELDEISEHSDDEFQLTLNCQKHGQTKMVLPVGQETAVRDAYLSQATVAKLELLIEGPLQYKELCEFGMVEDTDSKEMFELVRSVIEEHDVRFISESVAEAGVSEAWYYGRATFSGDEYVVKGKVSAPERKLDISISANQQSNLSSLMGSMRENLREVLLKRQGGIEEAKPVKINCTHCGAPLDKRALPGETIRCGHCGTPLHWT